jgi:hypothetical protein
MKTPAIFKQADLVRALRAAKAAGVEVGSYQIDRQGNIIVTAAGQTPASDYDRWQASQGRQ